MLLAFVLSSGNSHCISVILSSYRVVLFCIIVHLVYANCIDFTGT